MVGRLEELDAPMGGEVALRISMDGNWEASSIARHFSAMDFFYNFELAVSYCRELQERDYRGPTMQVHVFIYDFLTKGFGPFGRSGFISGPLILGEMRYGSPGFQDFLGLAGALKEIRKFIISIIREKQVREQHVAKMEREAIRLEEARIKIFERKMEILKRAGLSKSQMAEIAAAWFRNQHLEEGLIINDLVTDAEITDKK
jgi:hypothetical protein